MTLKIQTIKKRKDFLTVASNGNKSFGDFFIIQKLKKQNQEYSRFGFTVSKKVSKKAVHRNLIKRRIKHIITELESIKIGYDIVIIAKYRALNTSYQNLKQDFITLKEKMDI